MKITTRIIAGYAILIGLLAALVAYQVSSIHRMTSINREISRVSFQAAMTSLQLIRDRDLVEEYTRKTLALGDADYASQLKGYQDDFESGLRQLHSSALSSEEKIELDRLAQFWNSFKQNLARGERDKESRSDLPPFLRDDLDRLAAQAQTVYQANLAAIVSQAERSSRTGQNAEFISWLAAGTALIIGTLVSFLIFRSISIPLAHLTEGTRAIAEGKFFFRLDTSRRDEFSQLAKDFNTMTHRLNELDEMKKAFVSHVSHELKAPLASMRETILLLLEGIPGPLTDKQKRLLQLNLQSTWRLTSIIGNLLDLSKMEAGVMEYELKSQDIVPLLRTAIAELDIQAQEKRVEIQTEFPNEPLMVECDGDRIIQVLVNLIGNAVKFSPVSTRILVRACSTAQMPSQLPGSWRLNFSDHSADTSLALISVADVGPGIPDDQKEKIFDRFHQVKQGKKMPGQGVGLGLAICKTIIEAHQGAIWVEDNDKKGSVFQLLLQPGTASSEVTMRSSAPL